MPLVGTCYESMVTGYTLTRMRRYRGAIRWARPKFPVLWSSTVEHDSKAAAMRDAEAALVIFKASIFKAWR